VGALSEAEGAAWQGLFDKLVHAGRAVRREVIDGPAVWIAVEQWPVVRMALSLRDSEPPATLPASLMREVSSDEACQFLVRGRLEISGPITANRLAEQLGMNPKAAQI